MQTRISRRGFRLFHLVVLVASVHLSYLLAFVVRHGLPVPAFNFEPYLEATPWITLAAIAWFTGYRTYSRVLHWSIEDIWRLWIPVALINLTTMAISFFTRGFAFPRSVILIATALEAALVLAVTWLFSRLERTIFGPLTAVVVALQGDGESVDEVLELVREEWLHRGPYEIQGVFRSLDDPHLSEAASRAGAVVAIGLSGRDQREKLIGLCLQHQCELITVPDVADVVLHGAQLARVGDVPFFYAKPLGLTFEQRLVKRAFDIAVSALALVVLAPLFLVIAVLIKATSRGPVFYRQERVGRGGRTFEMIKFRSMVQDAEKETGPVVAAANDPRITPVGRFLRRTRLDELPQFWNILRGEMSVVGPRPERPPFVEQFNREIPHYRYRLLVKPGLTGLAQVFGKYETDPENKLKYDLYYIRNYSLALDLQILLRTVRVMLTPSAAEGVRQAGGGRPRAKAARQALDAPVPGRE